VEDAASVRKVSISCPVCEEGEVAVLYPEARDYITKDVFSVLGCARCRISWTDPVPANLDPYYPRSYRRYNAVIIAILKFLYRRRVSRWNRLFSKPGRALELGCGDGFMLNALQSLGWSVYGTERTEEMAAFARKHFGLTVFVENSQPLPAGETYDLVIMFQVLEHLAEPMPQLKRAASLLSPGGKLIIGVPNFASWQAKFGRDGWFHLDVPRHLFHWSPSSMREAAERAGMQVDSISFTSVEHDPYGWVQSILNRVFGNRNRLTRLLMRAEPWRAGDLITLALAGLLTPVAFTLSVASWICGRGAIMQAVLSKR
jgi:SAM-dependent methyltransferase